MLFFRLRKFQVKRGKYQSNGNQSLVKDNSRVRFFVSQNTDLDRRVNGNEIKFREDSDGKLAVFIKVGEYTTHDDLRKSASLAMKWQDRLKEWQIPASFPSRQEILLIISREIRSGYSYDKVARKWNRLIERNLCLYVLHVQRVTQKGAVGSRRDYIDFLIEETNNKATWINTFRLAQQKGADIARQILHDFRFNATATKELIHLGIKRIRDGKSAFTPDTPLGGEKIRSMYRAWSNSREYASLLRLSKRMEEGEDLEQNSKDLIESLRPKVTYYSSQSEIPDYSNWSTVDLWTPLE